MSVVNFKPKCELSLGSWLYGTGLAGEFALYALNQLEPHL